MATASDRQYRRLARLWLSLPTWLQSKVFQAGSSVAR